MVSKLWKTKEYDISEVLSIQKNYDLSRVQAVLTAARSLKDDVCGIADPYLFDDMQKAVDRIKLAISNNEKITVYGDYDADGVTATALLYLYLKENGADVDTYIPDRMNEGYGLNEAAVRMIKEEGTKLIVTVDNGIGSIELSKLIKELSMDLIVTDHHLGGDEIPEAIAILNCNTEGYKGKFKSFAGVGVAFKLVCALEGVSKRILDKYGDNWQSALLTLPRE